MTCFTPMSSFFLSFEKELDQKGETRINVNAVTVESLVIATAKALSRFSSSWAWNGFVEKAAPVLLKLRPPAEK